MSEDQLAALLEYRIQQANETFHEAEIDEQIAHETLNDTKTFISAVESYLSSTGYLQVL